MIWSADDCGACDAGAVKEWCASAILKASLEEEGAEALEVLAAAAMVEVVVEWLGEEAVEGPKEASETSSESRS